MINNELEGQFVQPDNLLTVLKSLLPNVRLSQTQWKIIINIGRSRKFKALININKLFKIIEYTCKNMNSHPIPKIRIDNLNNTCRNPIISKSNNFNDYYNNSDSKNYNFNNRNNIFTQNEYKLKDNAFRLNERSNTINKFDRYSKAKNILNPKQCSMSCDKS